MRNAGTVFFVPRNAGTVFFVPLGGTQGRSFSFRSNGSPAPDHRERRDGLFRSAPMGHPLPITVYRPPCYSLISHQPLRGEPCRIKVPSSFISAIIRWICRSDILAKAAISLADAFGFFFKTVNMAVLPLPTSSTTLLRHHLRHFLPDHPGSPGTQGPGTQGRSFSFRAERRGNAGTVFFVPPWNAGAECSDFSYPRSLSVSLDHLWGACFYFGEPL